MARTIQKKNNFNHGMVNQELVERSDLTILDKSAELLENLVPSIYGGVRSRRGTVSCDFLFFTDAHTETSSSTSYLNGTATSPVIDNDKLGFLQELSTEVQSNAVGANRELLKIDYADVIAGGATFTIKDIKLDFELPTIRISPVYTYRVNPARTATTRSTRVWTATNFYINNAGRGYRASDWQPTTPIASVTVNELGQLTALNPGHIDSAYSGGYTVQRLGSPRVESVIVQVSSDGSNWTDVATVDITESTQTFTVSTLADFRYVRLYRASSAALATSFTIRQITGVSTQTTTTVVGGEEILVNAVRTFPYVYNNEIKYLVILGDKNIFIYRDGHLVQQLYVAALTEEILPTIQYAAKDDTIIFTHPNMRPQRLMRVGNDTFSLGDFPLTSIPYELFGTEIIETKTSSITPSATDGNITLTGSGFTSDMVGQYIDGGGGRVKITDYVSATQLRARTIIPFYTTSAFGSWQYIHGYEPAWSNARGWPRTCVFVQQRLCFGGSRDMPNTLWLSRVGDYGNFDNIGNYDNDAIEWPLLTNSAIVGMVEQRNLHVFTSQEEWVVPENSYTPSKFKVAKYNENGCWARTRPIVYENSVLVIEKKGRNLYMHGYTDEGWVSRNISLYFQYKGSPIDLVIEKNSVKDKGDFLYVLLDNGEMCVQALGLSENINAPCIFKTEGKILSVCCVDEDVYLIVHRGTNVFVERIVDNQVDGEMKPQVVDGVIYGLGDYSGKRVYVKQGNKIAIKTVSEYGEIEVPSFVNDVVSVGLPFKYKLRSNPINIGGRTGSVRKRINRATIETVDTARIQLDDQILEGLDTYEFYAVSEYEKDCRYEITGEYTPIKILSVQLDVSYEG